MSDTENTTESDAAVQVPSSGLLAGDLDGTLSGAMCEQCGEPTSQEFVLRDVVFCSMECIEEFRIKTVGRFPPFHN